MRKLISTDLDGTILFDRRVGQEDLAAMARWRGAGHLLVVNTGKSIFATKDVLDPSGMAFDYAVTFTGAVITDGQYRPLTARFLPDGLAHEIVTGLAGAAGTTVFATTIEADYILADTIGKHSPILQVFEPMTPDQMAGHQFIGVPMRVLDDALRESISTDLMARYGTQIEVYRNQEFLDVVPRGSSKGGGMTELLAGPLGGEEIETWSIGDSWNDLTMHAACDHPVALPWSPQEVTASCERTVTSMAALIDSILEES